MRRNTLSPSPHLPSQSIMRCSGFLPWFPVLVPFISRHRTGAQRCGSNVRTVLEHSVLTPFSGGVGTFYPTVARHSPQQPSHHTSNMCMCSLALSSNQERHLREALVIGMGLAWLGASHAHVSLLLLAAGAPRDLCERCGDLKNRFSRVPVKKADSHICCEG